MIYDAIVIGLGGMGSAAAASLAHRGNKVLGIEQFQPGHDRGSSHGHTRIIRTAYYEHPDYVPLCQAAFQLWRNLEQRAARQLLLDCNCLSIGAPNGELITGVSAAARQHDLRIESLSSIELRNRFPQFRFDDSYVGILERAAGILYVDECVRELQHDARRAGATLSFDERVVEWEASATGVTVRTTQRSVFAKSLVITAGPWTKDELTDVNLSLTVMRQVPMWFLPTQTDEFELARFPVFIADLPVGAFYGMPMIDARGVKVAMHYGAPELSSAAQVDRTVCEADERPIRSFLQAHLPAADGPRTDSSVCIYTLTPDRHFRIDRHPLHRNVAIAAGFSGHGFKFAPVVGEILADLAMKGETEYPIIRFLIDRSG